MCRIWRIGHISGWASLTILTALASQKECDKNPVETWVLIHIGIIYIGASVAMMAVSPLLATLATEALPRQSLWGPG
jgi:hypothetical protein